MRKSITILIHNLYFFGGTTRAVTNIANLLSDEGYKVKVVSVFRGKQEPFFQLNEAVEVDCLIDYTRHNKYRFFHLCMNIFHRFFPLFTKPKELHPDEPGISQFSRFIEKKIIRAIKNVDSDVFISTRASYNLLAAVHAPKQVKCIAQEHMVFTEHSESMQKAIRKYYANFDFVTTLTKADAQYYRSFLPSDKVVVLPNMLPKEFRDTFIQEKEKRIISAGRFEVEKGFDLLIEAVSIIKDRLIGWEIVIFGDGTEKDNLQKKITENQLDQLIIIQPTTKNLQKEMQRAEIFALPSRFEGFGMVIVEAMACEATVVAFDCPFGPKEIITNRVNGLLVEEGNPVALGNALLELTNNNKLRVKLRRNGLNLVSDYSPEKILGIIQKMLDA